MAPDHATLRGAVELTQSVRWATTGWHSQETLSGGRRLWAEILENRRSSVRAVVSLADMHVTCTCFATRFPCRHVISLLLRDLEGGCEPDVPPDWVDSQLRRHEIDVPGSAAPGDGGHFAALIAGMADLRVWLGDLIRQGLATLPNRQRNYWLDAADRLVNAYAFDAARDLRECAVIPSGGSDWPEKLLPRLGKLALLAEAFQRFDQLSPNEQGDASAAAGRPPPPTSPGVRDNWLILGHRFEVESKQRRERTWLLGLESGRWAVLAESATVGRQDGICLPTGTVATGELAYLPSNFPLLARPLGKFESCSPPRIAWRSNSTGVGDGIAGYAAGLAANPWLRSYPMILQDVFIEPPFGGEGSGWRVRDRAGLLLSLPERFSHGWQLLALAADRPQSIFGEWDGVVFTPLSVFYDGGWRSMSAWRGLP